MSTTGEFRLLDLAATTLQHAGTPLPKRARLHLLVIGDDLTATHPLPGSGEVSIGRGENSDVLIYHHSISRAHALLRIGETTTIEDTGSVNGTRVRGEQLAPHRPVPIHTGEAVEVGGVTVLLQHRATPLDRPRLRTHGYFEGRLEDMCHAAARDDSARFAVLSLRVGKLRSDVEAVLARALRPSDVAASYAPGELEILLLDTNRDQAAAQAERLKIEIGDVEAAVGIASFPRDGRSPDALLQCARSALNPEAEGTDGDVVVRNPAMRQLYALVDRIATGTISVLLLGETGVGKEIFARAVHDRSPRRDKPFVQINCAAISETLLESELFGHEKGAFTGAVKAKKGLLENAAGGTILLDEVGELPLPIQAKLLRVLEDKVVLPVGSLTPRPIDVRFVAATNRDLEEEAATGRFRHDLYYRLSGTTLMIPPLRERIDEIEPLATALSARAAQGIGVESPPVIAAAVLDLLRGYSWPGNIRELRNVMERAVLLCTGTRIGIEHVPADKLRRALPTSSGSNGEPETARAPAPHSAEAPALDHTPPELRDLTDDELRDRQVIIDTLAACAGNQSRAAEQLGIARRTLTSRLDRYRIPRPRKKRR